MYWVWIVPWTSLSRILVKTNQIHLVRNLTSQLLLFFFEIAPSCTAPFYFHRNDWSIIKSAGSDWLLTTITMGSITIQWDLKKSIIVIGQLYFVVYLMDIQFKWRQCQKSAHGLSNYQYCSTPWYTVNGLFLCFKAYCTD